MNYNDNYFSFNSIRENVMNSFKTVQLLIIIGLIIVPITSVPCSAFSFLSGSKEQTFDFTLRGETGSIDFSLNNDYYQDLSSFTQYSNASGRELYMSLLDEKKQGEELSKLINLIKLSADTPEDQARIAISLVQKIPYDYEKSNRIASGQGGTTIRYPYQTLYDNKGVCSDKSVLLVYLLRELGFNTALLEFQKEMHIVVGIKCDSKYSYGNTGYAFIETTGPSIPTDSQLNYRNIGKLTSKPDIFLTSSGSEFFTISEEYSDAQEWNLLLQMENQLDSRHYYRYQYLINKYGLDYSNKIDSDIENLPVIDQKAWEFLDLGNEYYLSGDYEKALAAYENALNIEPEFAIAWNAKGNVFYNLYRYADAVSSYNQAIRINPKYANAYSNRGTTYANLGDYEKAIGSYNLALEYNRNDINILQNLGTVYEQIGKKTEAEQCYEKIKKIQQGNLNNQNINENSITNVFISLISKNKLIIGFLVSGLILAFIIRQRIKGNKEDYENFF
jgi:tetratricopeptide (TPR) repeat protein